VSRDVRYAGLWALVTGASAGLGAEFARQLAERGMHLVLTARRAARLTALAAELEAAHGIQCVTIAADLAAPGEAERLWREASADREIELLVNNAGFGLEGRFDEQPLKRQMEMVRLNCLAALELAHLALLPMRERGRGALLNVASGAAFQPIPQLAVYAATKAFLLSLSQALHDEQRGSGVRVLALCPGTVPTEFQQVAGAVRMERAPGVLQPDAVVRAALDALDADESVVVPGLVNRISLALTRLLPLPLASRLAGSAMAQVRRAAARR
jgi:short-subunit dehydrogenase